jgi:two-component system, cell cycle sensor histidine kinase and response regulator CckA
MTRTKEQIVGKILVVDDEIELESALVDNLLELSYEARGYASGSEALEVLRGEDFDLLISDLMMPEMDGIALIKAALEIDPNLVAIIMTGQGTIQTAVEAMKVGAFDYVMKPFQLVDFMPVLTRAMNTRHLRLENLQLRETVAIYELSQTIAFTLDPQTIISKVADAALQQTDADEVSILLPTGEGNELYVAAVRGENRQRLLGERVPLDQGISGWVARERAPLILNGEVKDARFQALWPHAEILSAISVPIQVANKLVGTINLNAVNRPRPFTLGQMKGLTILASTAAGALESASLYTQVQEAQEKYRSIFENAVEGVFQSTPEGRFITVNPSMARILGYESPDELMATITDITHQLYVHPESRAKGSQVQEECGLLNGFEFEAYRKDGKEIWLSLNRRSVRDTNGAEIYREGSIEDITERKRAEEVQAQLNAEIREQRERLNTIVASVPGIVFEAWGRPDGLDHRSEFVSEYIKPMLGYTVSEWLSAPGFWLSIVHPEDRDRVAREAAAQFETCGKGELEFRWIGKDKRIVWVRAHTIIVCDEDGNPLGMRGVVTDITERKRVERRQARRSVHALFRADVSAALAVSHVPLRDTLGACAEAMVRHLGAAFARIWTLNGVDAMLELQASAGMYTHLDGAHSRVPVGSFKIGKIAQERAPHITNDVQTDPRVSDKEWARREGMVSFAGYPLLVDNRQLGVVAMFSREKLAEDTLDALASVADLISQGIDRKRAEEGLRESEERYRLLFESNPQPMWVYDLETLKFLAVNASAVHHYGYSREDFLTMTIKDIRPAEDMRVHYSAVASPIGANDAGIWRHAKKDGTIIDVEITSHLLVFDDRQAELILAHDITESNRLKAALLSSEGQLRQSQKLEAIGQLAGGVAHDFNNLLTAINGYSDLALTRIDLNQPLKGYLEEIRKAGDRAANLTRQLLAFGRKQILQPLAINLNDVVSDMHKMLRRLIGEDIELAAKLNPELKEIKADPGQIEQVLVNLVVNARDAMPRGGKLTIETATIELDQEYAARHVGVAPGSYVMLAVSDTGTGISEETRTRIFEPFFTTKEKGKGTGLGLSTVYGIVKQSGGNIWVYSELGHGTTFKVYLPGLTAANQKTEDVTVEAPVPGGSETILVVEDEDVVRGLARQILEQEGYSVLEASRGEEALSLCAAYEQPIQLLLTDVVMPETSGKEVADRLRALHPETRVLFMSGYTDEAIVHHGVLDANVEFIQKPFTPAALARKVRQVIDSKGNNGVKQ